MSDAHETFYDIIAEMRFHGQLNIDAEKDKPEYGVLTVEGRITQNYADRLEAAHKREIETTAAKCCQLGRLAGYGASEIKHQQERGDCTKPVVDTKFELCNYPEQVLKIGRDFQNKDGFRGAHYDTVKLLCDTIEYQQEQLKTKTEVGNAAKLREACAKAAESAAEIMERVRYKDGLAFNTANYIAGIARDALAATPRNCDKYPTFNDAIRALADKRGWHDAKWDSERYCILAQWPFVPATEKEGGNDGNE